MNEQEFHTSVREKDYEAAVEKTWEADRLNADHTHEKDLYLLILDGLMTIEMKGETHALGPGQVCEVPGGLLHSEQAGPGGVRFLVAARGGPQA